jgi:5-methylcytosine-specific restriction endonuclease McrA
VTQRYNDAPRARKLAVLRRDGFRCTVCQGRFPVVPSGVDWSRWRMGNYLTVDHVIPRSKGGTNHQSNMVAMCHDCNQAKADRLPAGARLTQRIELVVA